VSRSEYAVRLSWADGFSEFNEKMVYSTL